MRLKTADIIITILVLFIAGGLLAANKQTDNRDDLIAYIEQDGLRTHTIELNIEGKKQKVIELISGEEAVLEIEFGKIRLLPLPHDDCPRGICSAMGWIDNPGQVIVCVPNRLVIGIEGIPDIDAISR